jgi:hypothetical protein
MRPSECHWSHDPAENRKKHSARLTRADYWLIALAILSVLWPAFWVLAIMSRAVALGSAV